MSRSAGCPLCEADGGVLIARGPRWRVIRADESGFPAFYRVVWNDHVGEFSDLDSAARAECIDVVVAVEQALRKVLSPTKINVASLGNMVAHLHWHVIGRFDWDSHFPAPVWAQAQREQNPGRLLALQQRMPEVDAHVLRALPGSGEYCTVA